MPRPLKLFLDTQNRRLVTAFDNTSDPGPLTFFAGDSGMDVELHGLVPAAVPTLARPFDYAELLGAVRLGLGDINAAPTAGQFRLRDPESELTSGPLTVGRQYVIVDHNGSDDFTNVGASANATGVVFTASGTTPAVWAGLSPLQLVTDLLDFDAAAAAVQTEIRARLVVNYPLATVSGNAGGPWTIDRVTDGDVAELVGIADNLIPDSIVSVINLRDGTSALSKRQRVRLLQRAVALVDSWSPLPAASIGVEETQTGSISPAKNTVQRVTISSDAYEGSFVLTCTTLGAANDVTRSSEVIPVGSTAAVVKAAVDAGFGAGNEVTVTLVNVYTWDVEFTGTNLAAKDMALMTSSADAIVVPVGLAGTLNLNTAGTVDLLGAATSRTDVTLEVEQSVAGDVTTLLQRTVTITDDLLDPETTGATPLANYLSVTEAVAMFVQFRAGITGIQGGGATKLDGITTADGAFPNGMAIMFSLSGNLNVWQLITGTNASDGVNYERPDDYDGSTNTQVWRRIA